MASSTTQRILTEVAARVGHPTYNPASNRTLGQILGLGHTQVRRLRDGEAVISREAFVRACKFLQLEADRIIELTLALDAESTDDAGLRKYVTDLARSLRGSIAKSSVGILLASTAMLAHVDDAKSTGKLVVSEHSSIAHAAPADARALYIMLNYV